MKAIVCEMCGSQDFTKQDGLFVCQHCRTKYEPEEAKKLMVNISGAVKIDRSNELDNLFKAARNARSISDYESALIYYQKISTLNPNRWEAMFYTVLLRADTAKSDNIDAAADNVANCIQRVFESIRSLINDQNSRINAVKEVVEACRNTAFRLEQKSINKLNSDINNIRSTDYSNSEIISSSRKSRASSNAYGNRWKENSNIAKILYICGNSIEKVFDITIPDYRNLALTSWKCSIEIFSRFTYNLNSETAQSVITKIKKYDPLYVVPTVKKSSKSKEIAVIIGCILFSIIIWWLVFHK